MGNLSNVLIVLCFLSAVQTSMLVNTKIPVMISNVKQKAKQTETLSEIDPNLDTDLGPANDIGITEENLMQLVENVDTSSPPVSENADVENLGNEDATNTNDSNPISKYCTCTKNSCNCCRDLQLPIPIIPVKGPGCATVKYVGDEKVSLSIKYGDVVLASRTVSGKNSKPICLPLPGGYSHFCGRVYGLAKGVNDFRACLGLELRADESTEAAVRVSCFKFGQKGLAVAEAEPFPTNEKNETDEDDDDILGFGGEDDEPDDDDDNDGEDDEDYTGLDYESGSDNVENPDYGGFSVLGSSFLGSLFNTQR